MNNSLHQNNTHPKSSCEQWIGEQIQLIETLIQAQTPWKLPLQAPQLTQASQTRESSLSTTNEKPQSKTKVLSQTQEVASMATHSLKKNVLEPLDQTNEFAKQTSLEQQSKPEPKKSSGSMKNILVLLDQDPQLYPKNVQELKNKMAYWGFPLPYCQLVYSQASSHLLTAKPFDSVPSIEIDHWHQLLQQIPHDFLLLLGQTSALLNKPASYRALELYPHLFHGTPTVVCRPLLLLEKQAPYFDHSLSLLWGLWNHFYTQTIQVDNPSLHEIFEDGPKNRV